MMLPSFSPGRFLAWLGHAPGRTALLAAALALALVWACAPLAAGPDLDAAIYADHTASGHWDSRRLRQAAEAALDARDAEPLDLLLPWDQTVFPRNMAPPLFDWQGEAQSWLVCLVPGDGARPVVVRVDAPPWEPDGATWEAVKQGSLDSPARAVVAGLDAQGEVVSAAGIGFSVARQSVDWPIMYQEMPLPFTYGREHPEMFTWRMATVADAGPPRTVLADQEVCGMCHHFSADGSAFGLDLDVDGDKGAFLLTRVRDGLSLTRDDLLSWTAFQDGGVTLGLFARISPDAGMVVATIREKSMLVTFDDPMFSEFFFPINGVLAYYRSDLGRFGVLPGADDPDFAHAGPDWSPDGASIVFSRAPVMPEYLEFMGTAGSIPGPPGTGIRDFNQRFPLRFDLYRLEVNGGLGGTPQPLQGASNNGHSNFWPRHSPDGKWLVFTRATNAMMNQPDSELWIIPAQGGEARRLACTRQGHNSWHVWSPDSGWLLFASKTLGPQTRLFLARMHPDGTSSPPAYLHRLATPGLASVLPEFAPQSLRDMQEIRLDMQ